MEQYFTLWDILELTLYLGSITYLVGFTYQLFISISSDAKLNLRQLVMIILTRLITIPTTLLIWFYWVSKLDIQFGPFLLPALIAEVFLSPLFLKFFGYSIWVTKKAGA